MTGFHWPEGADAFLREAEGAVTAAEAATHLGVPEYIIRDEARRLGVRFAPPERLKAANGWLHGWTDDRVAELKRLWGEGFSGNEIAKTLKGGLTRCAVLGKVHRLGLPQRDQPMACAKVRRPTTVRARLAVVKAPRSPRPPTVASLRPAKPSATATPLPANDARTYAAVSFLELNGRHQCGWHMGGDNWCAERKRKFFCEGHEKIGGGAKVERRPPRKDPSDIADIIGRRVNAL